MLRNFSATLTIIPLLLLMTVSPVLATDAQQLVKDGFNYWRGQASVAVVDMTVHRPDWERTMTIKAWTLGQADSLFIISAPPKDKGNGTLKKGKEMWMYNPKVNRVIKLPPSMMSQSWMGSDFSNNDLSKTDSLVKDYDHTVTGTEAHEGQTVYLIDSIPKPGAPVVWGMQKLKIRQDLIFLSQTFFDEDLKPVKIMIASQIQMLGGKIFPRAWRMRKIDQTDQYTELVYRDLAFPESLPANILTVSNLKNPRR